MKSYILVIFVLFFVISSVLTWKAYENFNNQRKDNEQILSIEAKNNHLKLKNQIEKWQNKQEKFPFNIKECLQKKEVAMADGKVLWPCAEILPQNELEEWIDKTGIKNSRLSDFENSRSQDPYLIRLYLKENEKLDFNESLLEELLKAAEWGQKTHVTKLDLSKKIWVNSYYKGSQIWRAFAIPDSVLSSDSLYMHASFIPGDLEFYHSQVQEADVFWRLNEKGRDFIEQSGSQSGFIFSVILTASVFVYGLYFFIRSQNNLKKQAVLKEQLVSDISHELRTPVTTLRMFAELLRDGKVTREGGQQEYYESLVKESRRLGRLIDNILDFSRLSKGKLKLNASALTLKMIDQKLKNAFELVDGREFIDIQLQEEELILAEIESTIQVFYNLITNAIKYAPGKKITVRSKIEVDRVVMSVSDEGQGIPESEIPQLFQAFFRGEVAHQSQIQGSGLGLGIAQALMRAMHGELAFVGNSPGAIFEASFKRVKEEV